jgi:hypothetical protein
MPEDYTKIKKAADSQESVCCSDGDHYPYGTGLSLEDDLVEDLGIGAVAVGDVVVVRGYAFVDSKSEHSSRDHSSKTIRLQLTSLKIDRETDDRVKQLYGG